MVSRSAAMARRSAAEIRALVSASSSRVVCAGRPSVAEFQRPDQRPVDDEVGIAADRRGEMRVAAQIEAEMPVIFRGVFRLRLGAQHDLVDEDLVFGARRRS